MPSVTGRIKQITQPRGGYLNPNKFTEIDLKSEETLNESENISAGIIGMAVDYLSRFIIMKSPLEEAFKISIMGSSIINESRNAEKLLKRIKGLDEESIISACKLVGYDVCFRAGPQFYKSVNEINPDENTINNIRIMVSRMKNFIEQYGPIVDEGMTFVGGYTSDVSSGDADFMTEDTLWDIKVSKDKPKIAHTLQLLMYYILGMHSDSTKYSSIKKLALYNPRLNKIYTIKIDEIDNEIITEVSNDVIGYEKNCNIEEKMYTVTELTNILGCSRYRVMQLYSEGMPLIKEKNKYVISKFELEKWLQEKEEEEKEREKENLRIFGITFSIIVIAMIVMLFIFKNML